MLGLLCRMKGHAPHWQVLNNGNAEFTRCRRCGVDMARRQGRPWKALVRKRVRWPEGTTWERRPPEVEMAEAPAIPLPALPVPETSAPEPASAASEATGAAAEAPRPAETPPPPPRDFMDDAGEDLFDWGSLRFRRSVSASQMRSAGRPLSGLRDLQSTEIPRDRSANRR